MSNPVASGECRYPDCIDCSSGLGHPPLFVVYDPEEGGYAEPEEDICIARHSRGGVGYAEGDVCGYPAARWAGDIPLCGKHYKRLMAWISDEDDIGRERERRLHAERMRDQEEYNLYRIQSEREQAEGIAPYSVVYYIRRVSDGMIKIGFSTSFEDRIAKHRRDYGTLQVLLVHGGGRLEEGSAHSRFSDYRIGRTEWFMPARPVLKWITNARRRHTHPEVQPEDIMPFDDLRQLFLTSPHRYELATDPNGYPVWPAAVIVPAS